MWMTARRFRVLKEKPTPVKIAGNIDELTEQIWNALDESNKVSLFVRFIDIETGKYESRIVNKNV